MPFWSLGCPDTISSSFGFSSSQPMQCNAVLFLTLCLYSIVFLLPEDAFLSLQFVNHFFLFISFIFKIEGFCIFIQIIFYSLSPARGLGAKWVIKTPTTSNITETITIEITITITKQITTNNYHENNNNNNIYNRGSLNPNFKRLSTFACLIGSTHVWIVHRLWTMWYGATIIMTV